MSAGMVVVAMVAPSVDGAVAVDDEVITVPVPARGGGPGYTLEIQRDPFAISTVRHGDVVLRTTSDEVAAFDFSTPSGTVAVTSVVDDRWSDGTLHLTLATTSPEYTVDVALTPKADRYRLVATVDGDASWIAAHYRMAPSGHWYGHGEATTDQGGPYRDQPWPLDTGRVLDTAFGPASYEMVEPFWFTQSGAGLYVDTDHLMTASIGGYQAGVAGLLVNDSATFDHTVFVERDPRSVYADYLGITGGPTKSDAPAEQYETTVWNSWAQFYTNVNQADFLAWARDIHEANIPGHTFNLDDGWMSHYGDFTFNEKFPDPKAMSDEIHQMGYNFGVWVTLWINLDADNYAIARDRGYLLKSKDDPSQPCRVNWWNGTAGIVDLANPEARDWYVGQLHDLMSTYGVDGFKFDTRFFDERCAPYSSDLTMADYQRLGAAMADEFDLQGMGIRTHWTGSQKYGFVMRQVDKGTSWNSLRAAVKQNLALSTVGYPFVTTDMIGGSLGEPPPTKQVLIRWAQAAAAMPLMYSSTSPLGIRDVEYDAETVDLYRAAVELHRELSPYILRQVDRAVAESEPIIKPLFFNYPKDAATYAIDNEWLLGDSLLAAPALTDAATRDIHVPAGEWWDVARHRVVQGPVTLHDYQVDLATLPLFVKLGTQDSGELLRILR
jgi:alpha-glucosidase (family GH31 glycosyl hydrolase)